MLALHGGDRRFDMQPAPAPIARIVSLWLIHRLRAISIGMEAEMLLNPHPD